MKHDEGCLDFRPTRYLFVPYFPTMHFDKTLVTLMCGKSEYQLDGTLRNYDRRRHMWKLKLPVLYVAGDHDEVSKRTLRHYGKLTPGTQGVEFIENARHVLTVDNPEQFLQVVSKFMSSVHKKDQNFRDRFLRFKKQCLRGKRRASMVLLASQLMKHELPHRFKETKLINLVTRTIQGYKFPKTCKHQSADDLQAHYDIWYLSSIHDGLGGKRTPPASLIECIANKLIKKNLSGNGAGNIYAFIHAYALKTLGYKLQSDPKLPQRALQRTRDFFQSGKAGFLTTAYYWTHEAFYGTHFGSTTLSSSMKSKIRKGLSQLLPELKKMPPSQRAHDLASEFNLAYSLIGVHVYDDDYKQLQKFLSKMPAPKGCHAKAVRLLSNESED